VPTQEKLYVGALPTILGGINRDKFMALCEAKEVEVPSFLRDLKTFTEEVLTKGTTAAFLWCSIAYVLVKKYPNFEHRAKWVFQESVKRMPHFYDQEC